MQATLAHLMNGRMWRSFGLQEARWPLIYGVRCPPSLAWRRRLQWACTEPQRRTSTDRATIWRLTVMEWTTYIA